MAGVIAASEASRITHEMFGEIRPGGSSLARPRAYFLVMKALRVRNNDVWLYVGNDPIKSQENSPHPLANFNCRGQGTYLSALPWSRLTDF